MVEADKTQLNAAIKTATDLRNDNGEYSSASWSALQDAIKAAEDVSKNTEASDDDVVNALNNLNDAQKALQAGPRKNLEFAVSQAASLNESDYTKASWKTFSDALSAARDALKNQSATESELQQAADNLSKSQDGLAKAATSADRKALIDEIGTAGTLGKADYTADSWKAYQDALDAAKAAANADDPSAKEIQDATANLAAARQALVENGSGNGSGSDNGGTAGGDTGNNNGNDNGDGNGNASDGDNPSNANDADDSAAGSDAPQTGDNLLGFAGRICCHRGSGGWRGCCSAPSSDRSLIHLGRSIWLDVFPSDGTARLGKLASSSCSEGACSCSIMFECSTIYN